MTKVRKSETFEIDNRSTFESVDVMNLATGEIMTYSHTNPLRACALAYLQGDLHDFNTWNYGQMIVSGDLVSITRGGVQQITAFSESPITVRVGNWSAFKDGRRITKGSK
jgi:hypothetical protein